MTTSEDFRRLQKYLTALNTLADLAKAEGDRETYMKIVDLMIDLENAHLDAGGELPLPA